MGRTTLLGRFPGAPYGEGLRIRVMYSLTRQDALTRSADITLNAMDVHIDLSAAADPQASDFAVTSTFTFSTASGQTFIDVKGTIEGVKVNGVPHPFLHDGARLDLINLPQREVLTVEVHARCLFSRTGEGLHRYHDPEDGRTYLYTQFEPNDAHRAWPCFDQPDMKAVWTFHITAPKHWMVTSNGMLIKSINAPEGCLYHSFTTTPALSSYITAIVAGEWDIVDGGVWTPSAQTVDACPEAADLVVPLRLMCRKALAQYMDAEDILAVTRSGLDYFHRNYAVAYPWGAYDQIFVPEYNLGAMENPGCVTFTESFLSRDTPTFADRQKRANVILHEMCHMWFGDLVTPQWWDDLWLKESFADNQGTMAAAEATPYVGEWVAFAVARKAWAYQQDLYPTTHPIAADIPDVDAAKNNFDGITYAKGASVLKQLVAWVGRETFFSAATRYFNAHAFGSTTVHDLLDALSAESGEDLTEWERLWLHTSGASSLTATWEEGPEGEMRAFTLTQGATPGAECVLRPHEVIVSTWALRGQEGDQELVCTHRFPVRIDGRSTLIDTERRLDHPGAIKECDLVVVNDDDLTYAVVRLDEHSTDTALAAISACPQPLTRAVVWASLWMAVRDGLLHPRRYVEAVLAHAPSETEEAVLIRLLATVSTAVSTYLPASQRLKVRESVVCACLEVLSGPLDSDKARQWARALLNAFQGLPVSSDAALAEVQAIAEGRSPLVPAGADLEWSARLALAARGQTTADALDMWLKAAHTGEAEVRHRRAVCALPDAALREATWRQVLEGTLSNDHLSACLEGLAASQWEGTELTALFFEELEPFWAKHSIGMGIRFLHGAFPQAVDIENPKQSTHLLEAARQWIANHPDAPHALRRLVLEHVDDIKRALNVQETTL